MNDLYYRPYSKTPYSFEDLNYIKKLKKDIKVINGDLHKQILNCKLLVLDHPGTTLLIALAANIPVICFWNRNHFPFSGSI